jgi:hypothetical protein
MHAAPEDNERHRAPDHGRRDVVEEARYDHDKKEQHHRAPISVWEILRQDFRDVGFFKVFCENRETEQKPEEIQECPPFSFMAVPARDMRDQREIGDEEPLENQHRGQAAQSDPHRFRMKQGHPDKGEGKENKLQANGTELRNHK